MKGAAAGLLYLVDLCKTSGGRFSEVQRALNFSSCRIELCFQRKAGYKNALYSLKVSLCVYLTTLALISVLSFPSYKIKLQIVTHLSRDVTKVNSLVYLTASCTVMLVSLKCLQGN